MLLLLIPAGWLATVTVFLALCRIAAHGDRAMRMRAEVDAMLDDLCAAFVANTAEHPGVARIPGEDAGDRLRARDERTRGELFAGGA